jgi:hypothetical protein
LPTCIFIPHDLEEGKSWTEQICKSIYPDFTSAFSLSAPRWSKYYCLAEIDWF